MWKRLLVLITILSFIFNVESQDTSENDMPDMIQNIHPSKAIVISIIAIMFAITFLFLAYVKLCRIRRHGFLSQNMNLRSVVTRTGSTYNSSSGIDKKVIETLPFFKFSSLKGSKSGLECAVCLCKFEDIEVLRLLPKCKHAFHMNCIDTWLESHSTCPLCRNRVDAGDIKAFASSISSRFLRVPSNLTEDPNLEIFVQREEEESGELLTTTSSSSRFNVNKWKRLKHYNHRIVISDNVVGTRSRWSDLNSSDLLSLNCEMMMMSVNNNHEIHHEAGEKRSMSEIANVARFEDNNRMKELEGISSNGIGREERMRKMWLPIVKRTVQWFAGGGDTSLTELEHTRCINSNV